MELPPGGDAGVPGRPDRALAWTLLIAGLLIAGLLALVMRLVTDLRQLQWQQAELAARLAARNAAAPDPQARRDEEAS